MCKLTANIELEIESGLSILEIKTKLYRLIYSGVFKGIDSSDIISIDVHQND